MAIMKTLFVASVLASSAFAAPFAALDVRAIIIDTVTETAYTIVDVTTTVWVNDAEETPQAPVAVPHVQATTTSSSYAAPVISSSAPAPAAPTPAAVAPSYSPAGFAAEAPSPTPPTTMTTSTVAPAPAAQSSTVTFQPKAVASGGSCEGSGSPCSGDVTHYDGGLGACGWNVNTNSDMQIALPHELMGTQSNGNPYCGRSLTIKTTTGSTVQATVGDKCMGCTGFSIDLTNALFSAVAPTGDGRVSNIEWWFD